MATGTVKKGFRVSNGYGFITQDDDGRDIYFNIKDKDNRYVPQPGEKVSFDIKTGKRGPYATNLIPRSYNRQFINPYNFIRPDDKVEKGAPISHHQFAAPDGGKVLHSGRIVCSLQIETPIFIPDPETVVYRIDAQVPEDWEWSGDRMEVFFRQDEHDQIAILDKWQEEPREPSLPEHLSLDDLEDIKPKVIEGRGTLFRGIEGRPTYVETSLPIRKAHKVMKFFRIHGKPAIPPTSLRGMIRSLSEALSNSCFSQFDPKRLCHRQVRWGGKAKPAIVLKTPENDRNGKLGLLDDHARISAYKDSDENLVNANDEKTGDAVYVTIKPEGGGRWHTVTDRKNTLNELEGDERRHYQGILKITGYNVDGTRYERVFFSDQYQVDLAKQYQGFLKNPENWKQYLGGLAIEDFTDEHEKDYNDMVIEQGERRKLSQEPGIEGRRVEPTRLQHDKLSVGDLVYAYFDDSQNLIGLFPVLVPLFWDQNSPYDLLCRLSGDLKPCNNLNSLCPCCCLFGMVSGDEQGQALAGKVAFTVACWANDEDPLWDTKTLQILSTPHPTCEQFYLIDEPNNTRVVRYDDRFERSARVGMLRGRKFYFHHRQIKGKYAYTNVSDWMNSTVELLTEGTFKFTVDFHNLTDYELGLLLYSLELEGPNSNLRHKLGMGKPLGLGSVKMTIDKLELIDRKERYRSILSDGILDEQEYRDRFILKGFKKVQAVEQSNDRATIEKAFNALPYIQDLKVMLAFKDFHGLEIKYPRARSKRDGEPYGYEWFQQKQNKQKPLPTAQEVNSNDQDKVLDGWS